MRYQYLGKEYFILKEDSGDYIVREMVLMPGVGKINMVKVNRDEQEQVVDALVEDIVQLTGADVDRVDELFWG